MYIVTCLIFSENWLFTTLVQIDFGISESMY